MANTLNDLSFKALFDAVADAMLLVDNTGHVIQANPVALKLLEYSEDEISGLEIGALMPESYRKYHHQYYNAFYKKPEKRSMGDGRELFALTRTGKVLEVDISLSPITIQKQLYVLVTLYAATKRLQAEEALQASEERLRLAKQAGNLGVFDYDSKLNILHYDERIQEFWGGNSKDKITFEKFIAAICSEDKTSAQDAIQHAMDPTSNGDYNAEFRIINPIGGPQRWINARGKVHFDNGQPTRFIGMVRDISERKAFEKRTQELRSESENLFKQQVASRTASAIAHDLNQPLAAVSAYSEVALHELQSDSIDQDKLKRALNGCVAQAQRAGKSLHELLAFLQKGELVTEPLDINMLVKEAIDIVRTNGYGEFQLVLKLDPNMPAALGNRIQVQKVLVNLLRNSVEAMQNAGISTSAITIVARTNQEINMAHVTVQDNGPWLDVETAKRIFEPFFTTKPTGIGMGLAISRALIETNGGQLWLEPSTKPGATFHFTLPFAP